MDHHTPVARLHPGEKPRAHIATERLAALGLPPARGWGASRRRARRRARRERGRPRGEIEVGGARRTLAELRAALIVETPGDSLAYLTDFLLDGAAMERLVPVLGGVGTVVCECQYRAADAALAARHRHMAAPQVAELARRAGVGRD